MSNKANTSPEEIDLGALLKQMVLLFTGFFAFIGNIFKSVFKILIGLLLFLRKHIIKLGIAIVLGASVGVLFETISPEIYHYDMIVEPNYKAVYQLSERIQYYNSLIESEDSLALAKLFNINFDDANSLLEFEIIRQEEYRDIIEAYDEFIKDKDSLSITKIAFYEFVDDGFSFFDAKQYVVRMLSLKNKLSHNIQPELIEDLENNQSLIDERNNNIKRLELKEERILQSIKDIDSLRETYKKIGLLLAENSHVSGTAIEIFDSKKADENEIKLFYIYQDAYKNLDTLLVEKEKMKDVFKIVTPFKPLGISKVRIIENKVFKYTMIFLFLTIFFILIKDLDTYLKTYKSDK